MDEPRTAAHCDEWPYCGHVPPCYDAVAARAEVAEPGDGRSPDALVQAWRDWQDTRAFVGPAPVRSAFAAGWDARGAATAGREPLDALREALINVAAEAADANLAIEDMGDSDPLQGLDDALQALYEVMGVELTLPTGDEIRAALDTPDPGAST